jgi:hypothetical protein
VSIGNLEPLAKPKLELLTARIETLLAHLLGHDDHGRDA